MESGRVSETNDPIGKYGQVVIMRYRFFLIALLMCTVVCRHAAADAVVHGTVVSMDRSGGRLTVLQPGTMRSIPVMIAPDRLPRAVAPGASVRIRGTFRNGVLRAERIVPMRSKSEAGDPTGVRSRLFKSLRGF